MKRFFMAVLLAATTTTSAQNTHPTMAVVVQPPKSVFPTDLFEKAPVLTVWDEKHHTVPIYYLETKYIKAATQDEFAIKLGTRLRDLTAQSGFENCAALCVARINPKAWGAVVTTAKSHSMCLVVDVCPEGYQLVNSDIHSHIHRSLYQPNDIDRQLLGKKYGQNDLVLTIPDEFSEEDYSRSGYMVSAKNVWHQNGKNKIRKVAVLR